MKVKNDHRSKFSNLSIWKEEAWKKSRLQQDSNPWPPRIPVRCSTNWAMKPYIGSEVNLLSSFSREEWNDMRYIWNNSYIWTAVVDQSEEWSLFYIYLISFHSSRLWSTTAVQMYELFHIYLISFHSSRENELNKLTSLPMYGFIAQLVEHRTGIRGGHGFESCWSLDFFRLLLSNCLNWKIYCDDHSSLWSNTAVQMYELFHIYLISLIKYARWFETKLAYSRIFT